jgi:hypothetical protein
VLTINNTQFRAITASTGGTKATACLSTSVLGATASELAGHINNSLDRKNIDKQGILEISSLVTKRKYFHVNMSNIAKYIYLLE